MAGRLETLPPEMLVEIFNYLPMESLANLIQVSSDRIKKIIADRYCIGLLGPVASLDPLLAIKWKNDKNFNVWNDATSNVDVVCDIFREVMEMPKPFQNGYKSVEEVTLLHQFEYPEQVEFISQVEVISDKIIICCSAGVQIYSLCTFDLLKEIVDWEQREVLTFADELLIPDQKQFKVMNLHSLEESCDGLPKNCQEFGIDEVYNCNFNDKAVVIASKSELYIWPRDGTEMVTIPYRIELFNIHDDIHHVWIKANKNFIIVAVYVSIIKIFIATKSIK